MHAKNLNGFKIDIIWETGLIKITNIVIWDYICL